MFVCECLSVWCVRVCLSGCVRVCVFVCLFVCSVLFTNNYMSVCSRAGYTQMHEHMLYHIAQ